MTQYLLSVHMVEGEPDRRLAQEEMQQAYKDVDTFNAELQARAPGCSPAGCTPPTPPPSCACKAAR